MSAADTELSSYSRATPRDASARPFILRDVLPQGNATLRTALQRHFLGATASSQCRLAQDHRRGLNCPHRQSLRGRVNRSTLAAKWHRHRCCPDGLRHSRAQTGSALKGDTGLQDTESSWTGSETTAHRQMPCRSARPSASDGSRNAVWKEQ